MWDEEVTPDTEELIELKRMGVVAGVTNPFTNSYGGVTPSGLNYHNLSYAVSLSRNNVLKKRSKLDAIQHDKLFTMLTSEDIEIRRLGKTIIDNYWEKYRNGEEIHIQED